MWAFVSDEKDEKAFDASVDEACIRGPGPRLHGVLLREELAGGGAEKELLKWKGWVRVRLGSFMEDL
ncbi:hypothetical protein QJS10_CPA09g00322 [Acorus calamus]|uniref:Uncharacterized protein n=1 Tax=Acorus calamus TaxID=4465 RepID=A0AAV9E2A3_ACOCL|nr:hypothetical protein QJS10_CPA09g00322 [Acorus calamus]